MVYYGVMALTKGDKDWFKDALLEFHREVDEPRLNEILEDIRDLKENMAHMESRLDKKIDKVAEVMTDVKTNHERRLRTLEKEAGIEPPHSLMM